MKHKYIFCFILILCLTALLSGCAQPNELNNIDTSNRGNSDGNLHNLGLTAATEDAISYIGSTDIYDLIYIADRKCNPQKAITGLTGYIRYLNYLNGTYWFIGITYDENDTCTEAIFSYEESTDTQECLYEFAEGDSVSYFNAIGDLLIFALNRNETTEIHAVNCEDKTEAVLLKSNHELYDININGSFLYYLEGNSIKKAELNGNHKTKVYTSENQLGHFIIENDILYFIEWTEDGDIVYALKESADKPTVIYNQAKRIDHLNGTEKGLIFSSDNYRDGELLDADILYYDFDTEDTKTITSVEGEYIGLEVAADNLIIHKNDEALSVETIPLP